MMNPRKSADKDALRQLLIDRIDERRAALGIADNEISLAGGNRYIMRDLRGRGSIPSAEKLSGIAHLLGVSVDWLTGRSTDQAPPAAIEAKLANVGDVTRAFRQQPNDLPVYGTAHGHTLSFGDDGQAPIEVTLFEPGDVVRRVARPPALANQRAAYALYVQGDSMFPAHKPGSLVVVNPAQIPAIGDDVIVQLLAPIDDGQDGQQIVSVLIKTLVKRSASFVELYQYQPEAQFRVPRERIAAIHRVVPLGEMLGG
ncbi:MAG: S24 family peptidase [Sphingopyxis sp.]